MHFFTAVWVCISSGLLPLPNMLRMQPSALLPKFSFVLNNKIIRYGIIPVYISISSATVYNSMKIREYYYILFIYIIISSLLYLPRSLD